MDNPEQQNLSPAEKKFADNNPTKVVKSLETGKTFTVWQGLPREEFKGAAFTIPENPHVFQADQFSFTVGDEAVVKTKDVNVLYMHGIPKNGVMYPQEKSLRDKGISIEDLVKSYEESSGRTIDVLFVCNSRDNSTPVRVFAFSEEYGTPRVLVEQGAVSGSVRMDPTTGYVEVDMEADTDAKAHYKRFNQKGKVKVLN